ncbi:hypothetical protein EES39_34340 [Streptomyces sp. ADI92-24]|uniref:hypothetical protein n=1 Tax=Streptomyces sp. ADI92-24 TaxID=1522756 RepID=UPI000F5598A5|nr:hypothetical protein [Streptomyces sp. ADI92-24]RPK34735.1 hypothetical protein EES39_34340 [Streptomyces sp. ADI92-24]
MAKVWTSSEVAVRRGETALHPDRGGGTPAGVALGAGEADPHRAVGAEGIRPGQGEGLGRGGAARLDRELFNVTKLVECGYDDAHRPAVPLIATYSGAPGKAGKVLEEAAPATPLSRIPDRAVRSR